MDNYKFASQNRLRFPSIRGALTVEQLFDLPLKSQSGFDLDTAARAIYNDLKESSEMSFVEAASASPENRKLEVALEIVKDVIKTKQDENAAKLNRAAKADQRRKILDALETKRGQELTAASIEDLTKQLKELEE